MKKLMIISAFALLTHFVQGAAVTPESSSFNASESSQDPSVRSAVTISSLAAHTLGTGSLVSNPKSGAFYIQTAKHVVKDEDQGLSYKYTFTIRIKWENKPLVCGIPVNLLGVIYDNEGKDIANQKPNTLTFSRIQSRLENLIELPQMTSFASELTNTHTSTTMELWKRILR